MTIDIKDFKSGIYKCQNQYQRFRPSLLNVDWQVSDKTLIYLLSLANISLGELNTFSSACAGCRLFYKNAYT